MVSEPQKPARAPITITTSTNAPAPFANLLTRSFLTDPAYTFFLNHVPWYLRPAALYNMMAQNLVACSVHRHGRPKATFYSATTSPSAPDSTTTATTEAADLQCCAVIIHPGTEFLDLGPGGWFKMFRSGLLKMLWYAGIGIIRKFEKSFEAQTQPLVARTFGKKPQFYYVWHITTDEAHRGKGLAAAVIRDVQKTAQREGLPVWLEASTPGSREVYLKSGFVDVKSESKGTRNGEIRLGVGVVDESGERVPRKEDAVGVPVFPMVWWPEGYEGKE